MENQEVILNTKKAPNKLVEISIEKGRIHTKYVLLNHREGDLYNFIIPGFEISFSASTLELGHNRAKKALKFFYDYWLQDESFKKMILEFNKLGFKTKDHNITLKNLMNKKINKAKFISNINQNEGFESSEEIFELTEI